MHTDLIDLWIISFFQEMHVQQPSIHLCFLFNLWKFGFISWLLIETGSVAWIGWNGTRGFFVGKFTFETGDTTFVFNSLGTSNLSKILEVSLSSCLLLSRGKPDDWSNLTLGKQDGEYILESSFTTNCSHSSVIQAMVLSSWFLWSECNISSFTSMKSLMVVSAFIVTSDEGCSLELGSEDIPPTLGSIDLQYNNFNEHI